MNWDLYVTLQAALETLFFLGPVFFAMGIAWGGRP